MTQHSIIDTTVRGLGYDLVDVERAPAGLLRVTIDHPFDAGSASPERFINVDDCEKVTRQLQHVLEVEGMAYERLEVSSPGLDRPLKTAGDFARFAGEQVEVTLKVPFKGRKRFRGELFGHDGAWRLVLAPTAAKAAAKRHAASRSAQGRRAAAEAAGGAPAVDAESGGPEEVKVLDFSMDEVREARLVPVIDFKGRRSAPADAPVGDRAVTRDTRAHDAMHDEMHEEMDGGRIQ